MNFLNNTFVLYDASPTHLQVLFRSFPTHPSKENLDILVQGVTFLQIPSTIKGMSIEVKKREDLGHFELEVGLKFKPDNKLFVITEKAKKYYIVAEKISYQRNQLTDTSLPIKLESSEDVERLFEMAQSGAAIDWMDLNRENNPLWIEISG